MSNKVIGLYYDVDLGGVRGKIKAMRRKQLKIIEKISFNEKMNEYKDHALKNSHSGGMFGSLFEDLANLTKDNHDKTSAIDKFAIKKSKLDEKVEVYRDAREWLKNSNENLVIDLTKQTLARNEADVSNVDLRKIISKVQQDFRELKEHSAIMTRENAALKKKETEAQKQISALKNEKTQAHNKNQVLERENAALRKKETQAQKQISALKNEKTQVQTKNQVLGSDNSVLRKKETETQTQKNLLQDGLRTSEAEN